jgi:site-specific DNA-methyltransferase (adenine-specific)
MRPEESPSFTSGSVKPYYSDDHVTLFHGDCREVSEWLTADVLVTDPPYGIDQGVKGPRRGGGTGYSIVTDSGRGEIDGDLDTGLRDEALAMWGKERPALVFGSWRAPRPTGVRARLLWLKAGTVPCLGGTPWSPADEEIYVLGSGWERPSKLNYLITSEARAGSGGLAAKVGHPTPKPVDLMRLLLADCPAGVVADPFAGSGATLRAAKDFGRKAIGVESVERFCEIAALSCSQEVLVLV